MLFSSWMFRLPDVPTDALVLAALGTAVQQTAPIIVIVVLDGLN